MSLLKPFRALRYDPESAGSLDRLVAPPHDVVTPEVHQELLDASPYNAVRLVKPEAPEEAARDLVEWRQEGVLVREEQLAAWILEEVFVGPDGVERTRRGLVARIRLLPYSDGRVLPHERTFSGQKEARLPLLQATHTKLSPILLLHAGEEPVAPSGPPELEAVYGGTTSRLWRANGASVLDAVRGPIVIADGHHRYETALRFHEEAGTPETAHVLAVLVTRDDPGLVIFPTHRIARGAVPELNGSFRLTELSGGASDAIDQLGRLPRDHPAFVLLRPGRTVLVESDPTGSGPLAVLDTTVVDRLAPPDLAFTASAEEAERAVAAGGAQAAFLVRAPTMEQVEAVALAGETMPQKSTYFFPKLTSGLLFSPFDE
ncbi:MAG TPA: DUF1015 domain-containing protein [Gaiellaceae bacterium]|nr:DUF1015 domain-containing protein [Gaiellaceae bacterium]